VLNDHFNILEAANIADCKSFLELSMKISKFYNKLLIDAQTEKAWHTEKKLFKNARLSSGILKLLLLKRNRFFFRCVIRVTSEVTDKK